MEKREGANNRNILIAFDKGYRVNWLGLPINKKGINKSIMLKQSGYAVFNVSKSVSGKDLRLKIPVHRLLAYQKFGDRLFEPGIMVRHRNGISSDNRWDNILIGTALDNCLDRYKHRDEMRPYLIKKIIRSSFDRAKFLESMSRRFASEPESTRSRFVSAY